MPGSIRPGILDPRAAFEDGFGQVADDRPDAQTQAEDDHVLPAQQPSFTGIEARRM